MSTVAAIKHHYSIEEYLAAEDKADYEYYAGEIYPMAGGTLNHNQIVVNLCIILGVAFKNREYRVFAGDVRFLRKREPHSPCTTFTTKSTSVHEAAASRH